MIWLVQRLNLHRRRVPKALNNWVYPHYFVQPNQQRVEVPPQPASLKDEYDWYSDVMDLTIGGNPYKVPPTPQYPYIPPQPIQNPPAVIAPQDSIFNQIDNLINNLKDQPHYSSPQQQPVETGKPRLGKESRYASDIEIMTNHLKNVVSVYPGVSFDIVKSAYEDLYDLRIFYNGYLCDSFVVNASSMYGVGCPVIVNGNLMKFDQLGRPEPLPIQIPIPLGSTLAMRQMIFRNVPPDERGANFCGVAPEVYNEYMYRLMDQEVYRLVDFSSSPLPDDEDNYIALGKKILRINAKYPLKARYRMYHYEDNDHFYLISDKLVKKFSIYDEPVHTNTFIEVNGNDLIITEPTNTKKLISIGE